ncbi:MAG: hypothetical protein JNJ41_02425 [Bacteroidia bacterium]|nr:hypothetical protein [Bacteroidia bacterium]
MIKLPSKKLELRAGKPIEIFVNDGIDFHSLFHFYYPASAEHKKLSIALKNENGQVITKSIFLTGLGYQPFKFEGAIEEMHMERNFGSIKLNSEIDMELTLSIEENSPALVGVIKR